MKINAEQIKMLRRNKSWSQDELAISTGLNLRTIQRIEREGTATLQSRKALASAFEVDIKSLDYEEQDKMTQYEFKTIEIETNEGFLAGIGKSKLPDFEAIFNEEGQNGWSLVQILTPDMAQNLWAGRTGKFLAILQRERI